ncbi:cuticle protein 16.5-like [Phlebotomus argentipes]|uniref:cuticle protein 16.5-like n=1 Tax=Phlebotomus argentipes TaxID=94469 RepID=UPI002892E979|nr:cuticle protein 16.5-like [Phlebotomus argentipes]
MFKLIAVLLFTVALVSAKPQFLAPVAYSAPLVAGPGVVTATSSQVVARNYNGVAAPLVAASAPLVAAPAALPYSAYPAYSAYSAYPYTALRYPYAPYVF